MPVDTTLTSVFLEQGMISPKELDAALAIRNDVGEDIGHFLVRLGMISEHDRVRCVGLQHGIQFVELSEREIDPDTARLIPHAMALRYKVIAVEHSRDVIKVAMANPLDVQAIDDIATATDLEPIPMIAVEDEILEAIFNCFGAAGDISDIIVEAIKDADAEVKIREEEPEETDSNVAELRDLAGGAPVVRLVNAMIARAIAERASDIHIEPEAGRVRVRLRVDGILHEVMTVPKDLQSPVISRIKVMAGMDVAERRAPQDGRITLVARPQEYDFRISTYPAVHGENVVIRVLEKSAAQITLDKLGLGPDIADGFSRMVHAPYGMILTCGPTGAGKTTTLYAALNMINSVERNILTIEDPVEYQLPGVIQANVNRKAGLTFATGLRTMVRQDPDVILVGEIRDSETAEIAVEAALTGHLVLSTLHANDSAGAAARLIDMGVEPFLVASSIVGLLAQRLVRSICPRCASPFVVTDELLEQLKLPVNASDLAGAMKGAGCEQCGRTGYKGRLGIYELLLMDDDIRAAIIARDSAAQIRQIAMSKGMRTLRQDALEKVKAGLTTIEEVMRVTTE
ncbi:MAG: ATPase, T2SS/T4P/T4SS family [Armatimonadota bacterium]|nr:Flp pilus assembly complex ATPase component TadA [bacterium]